MLYEQTTAGTVDAVCDKLCDATTAHNFGVLGIHDLKRKMEDKGVPFSRECRIIEVCNPRQAKVVLEANMAISTALPCRIAVYEEGDAVKVSTLKPTAVLALYGSVELESVAKDVERTIVRIIDAACA
jgi:uncharacterized protein (DUF302 family)